MADPDGTVEVRGKVTPPGAPTPTDPEAIVAEIEATRVSLAETIDALAEKVSPANNVRKLREKVAETVARPDVQLAAVAVGLAVLGFAVYRVFGRRRK